MSFLARFSKKYSSIKIYRNLFLGADFMYVNGETDGLTEIHDGTKCHFLQFCERVKKLNLNIFVLAIQNELEYADNRYMSRDAV
jgi:hypothetical protein